MITTVPLGFFLRDPANLYKHLRLNDLLKLYVEKFQDADTEVFISFEAGKVANVALYKDSVLYKVLISTSIRTSQKSKELEPVLYEITFSSLKAPEVRLFRYIDNTLRFTHCVSLDQEICFVDTPLELRVQQITSENQTAVRIFNRAKNLLFEVTSAHLIKDPKKKLKAYFECLESGQKIDIFLSDLLEEMDHDSNFLDHTIKHKHWIYKKNYNLKAKTFFEGSINKNLERSEKIDGTTALFVYNNETKLQLVKYVEQLDQASVEEALSDLSILKNKYLQTVENSIEFIVSQKGGDVAHLFKNIDFALHDLEKIYITYEDEYYTFQPSQHSLPQLHPFYYNLFELDRFSRFDLNQVGHLLFIATAKTNAKDQRLIGLSHGSDLEEMLYSLLTRMKNAQPLFYNRIIIHLDHSITVKDAEQLVSKYWLSLQDVNIEKLLIRFGSELLEVKNILYQKPEFHLGKVDEERPSVRLATPQQLRELQVLSKNCVWAYRMPTIITALAHEFRKKELGQESKTEIQWDTNFVELDLDHSKTVIDRKTGFIDYNYGELIEVQRPIGSNESGIVIGIKTDDLGIGKPVKRILIIGDLTHSSRGAIRAQECARVNAAIRYAEKHKLPIDWFTASFGVQVHREKGVEGLDAAASTIREIVLNCHHKRVQINLVVDETNIGAQSYWDAMATILNETSGILIMTPRGCMALTGPSALVSALYRTVHSEELPEYTKTLYPKGLQSLSGYETVHGPNSDSMLFAKNIKEACYMLLKHHYYSYIHPSEKITSIRPQLTVKEHEENVDTVRLEIDNFLKGLKPNREIILDYIRDKDSPTALQFWKDIKGIQAQEFKNGDLPQTPTTIVEEMLIGGFPTLVIFTATGPLTPVDAEIIARGIYKASARMQVLVIGSLSGFSCDPLSMTNRQLQAGSYIAKAIVDHDGPMLIVNLGNLVGGTFVVFNKQLNPDVRILAIEGARVQVVGGKAAAKVVFHSQISKRADSDSRVIQAGQTKKQVIEELEDKEAEIFDRFHNAQRAVKVGSIDQIISFEDLRGSIILAFEEMRAKYLRKVA